MIKQYSSSVNLIEAFNNYYSVNGMVYTINYKICEAFSEGYSRLDIFIKNKNLTEEFIDNVVSKLHCNGINIKTDRMWDITILDGNVMNEYYISVCVLGCDDSIYKKIII